ncbi:MAG: L,D-transpeptidase [Nocardioidaceae bacterium]|nr:L,D-transpeptidase [Nocardioidaceae bacterium]
MTRPKTGRLQDRGAAWRHGSKARRPWLRRAYRIATLVASLTVTASTVVVAVGILPYPGDRDHAVAGALPQALVLETPVDEPTELSEPTDPQAAPDPPTADLTTAPPRSGHGRRVVYDMGDQRVWLVRANGTVLDSYLVSGSRLDNLEAGRYEVYSKSVHATGYTEDTSMRHMVRFTYGENAAIGFHDLPVDHRGDRVQSIADLGTPLSDGCIRQAPRDARQLWAFAPVGTRVVVLD